MSGIRNKLYLSSIFQIDALDNPELFDLFKELQKSNYHQSIEKAKSYLSSNDLPDKHRALLLAILFEAYFFQNGAHSKDLEQLDDAIQIFLGNTLLGPQCAAQLELKRKFFCLERIRNGIAEKDKLAVLRSELRKIFDDDNLDAVIRGEAAFYLGRSYFKTALYDIRNMQIWMRAAIEKYDSSFFPINKDRVLNDWGHNETFFYNLSSGICYLEESLYLKSLKRDSLGSSIAKGCMADVALMEGRFDDSINLYKEDLNILQEVGSKYNTDGVTIKLAEAWLKKSMFDNSCNKEEVQNILASLEREDSFFAIKAWFKFYYYQWWYQQSDGDSISVAESKVNEMQDKYGEMIIQNNYLAAFYKLYSARIAIAKGDIDSAVAFYNEACGCFKSGDFGLPLYAYLAVLERERWKMAIDPDNIQTKGHLITATKLIKRFFIRKGKQAGAAYEWILEKSEDIETALLKNKFDKALPDIDRVIWFLEK